jgi:hypothetical protein
VDAAPANPSEAAVRAVVDSGATGPAAAAAFARVAQSHPGTTGAGLAQLAAGLTLLEADRAAEAVAPLEAADVRRTALADYALAALASGLSTLRQPQKAADAAAALVLAYPQSPLVCPAVLRSAEAEEAAARPTRALPHYERLLTSCPGYEARALVRLATLRLRQGDRRTAYAAWERLDRTLPASPEARDARALAGLAALLPPPGSPGRRERDVQ